MRPEFVGLRHRSAGNVGDLIANIVLAEVSQLGPGPAPAKRRNASVEMGAISFGFSYFRLLLGLAIAEPVTSGLVFFHDGPVPIDPTPRVDDNSAAAANKQCWRLPVFGRD